MIPILRVLLLLAMNDTPVQIDLSVSGYPICQGIVDSQEGWAVLDTGSNASAMDAAFAAKHIKSGSVAAKLKRAEGSVTGRRFFNVEHGILGQDSIVNDMAAFTLEDLSERAGRPISFVFGTDVLRNNVVQFNDLSIDVHQSTEATGAVGTATPFANGVAGRPIIEAELSRGSFCSTLGASIR
jgi:hypothetical protein